jgi:hypothetical protein
MLADGTGYTNAFERRPGWILNIPATLPPIPGQEKMEKMEKFLVKMEKFLVRMEKFLVRMEKNDVCSWQDWSFNLEAVARGVASGHMERALRYLFRSEIKFRSGEDCRIWETTLDSEWRKLS